jgi:3-oxoacyl-[acyl-carrier protein] reductase
MQDQNKKTVVVTGGSRGIGRAVCLAFAGPDHIVYFNYISSEHDAAETERLVSKANGLARGIKANVSSEKGVADFFDAIRSESGGIDVLVNNAGITKNKLLVRTSEDEWNDIMNVNLKGAFLCSKIAAKIMMKQKKGRIINISSIVGVTGNPGQSCYAASKSGLIGFTKSIALELASRNITVNSVAPGFIETDMTASLPKETRKKAVANIPLGRIGKPEDVAAAVMFLASDSADFITGQVIHVNGGMYV